MIGIHRDPSPHLNRENAQDEDLGEAGTRRVRGGWGTWALLLAVTFGTLGLFVLSGIGGSGGTPEPGQLTPNEVLLRGAAVIAVIGLLGVVLAKPEDREGLRSWCIVCGFGLVIQAILIEFAIHEAIVEGHQFITGPESSGGLRELVILLAFGLAFSIPVLCRRLMNNRRFFVAATTLYVVLAFAAAILSDAAWQRVVTCSSASIGVSPPTHSCILP